MSGSTVVAAATTAATAVLRRNRSSRRGPSSATGTDVDQRVAELVDQHAEAIYRVALGVVRDPSLAEDVVQETIIKAWQSMGSFRGEGSVRSWVLSIAHNTAVSTLRRSRERATDPGLMPDTEDALDVERHSEGRADLRLLAAALETLDPVSRSIVVMRDVEGMAYQQISDALDVPLPTVKTRLLRARRELQRAVLAQEHR